MTPLVPFEPIVCDRGPDGGNWIAQIKWDGVRMLAYHDGKETRLINRKRNDRTMQYPEFQRTQDYCSASSFILDGEMIAFDANKPSFHEVMRRDGLRRSGSIETAVRTIPVVYMIFDILYLDGQWVMDRPLTDRQRLLEQAVLPGSHAQLTANFPDGDALFAAMKERGMEGVVYKDLTSLYTPDAKDGRWRKRKITRDLYAVVGGVTYRDGTVNALLLGLYAPSGQLHYIGHAGTGKLSHAEWGELTRTVAGLRAAASPFANVPSRNRDAVWVEPRLVVKVNYLEWTEGGTMRQPSIQAVTEAVASADCGMDQV
nr:RNA ligase family protein [Cohnella lubricantis]